METTSSTSIPYGFLGPLTTVFTPPPSCTGYVKHGNYEYWHDLGAWGTFGYWGAECFPTSFHPIAEYIYYSPGCCPSCYSTVSRGPIGHTSPRHSVAQGMRPPSSGTRRWE